MKFCDRHWQLLRAAINKRGLTPLTKSGEAHVAALAEKREGPFDPLMGAHNMIVVRVLDGAGLILLVPNEDGTEKCPQCFAQATCTCTRPPEECQRDIDAWTDQVADLALEEATRRGLVPSS